MHGKLTPYTPRRTPAQRRPWWQRSYDWNLWWVWGVGILLALMLLLAHLFVSVLEALA